MRVSHAASSLQALAERDALAASRREGENVDTLRRDLADALGCVDALTRALVECKAELAAERRSHCRGDATVACEQTLQKAAFGGVNRTSELCPVTRRSSGLPQSGEENVSASAPLLDTLPGCPVALL